MTVIAGVVHDGQVYMAADSLVTGDGRQETLTHGKLWQSGGMLFGVAGGLRELQVARYAFSPPPLTEGQDAMAYLCTSFVGALRAAFKDADLLTSPYFGMDLMLGWRGRLFVVSGRFCVAEYTTCWAEGSGGKVATGVLLATADLPPRERLRRAVEAAELLCEGVRGPFTYLPAGAS